jgi:hypothetical protein
MIKFAFAIFCAGALLSGCFAPVAFANRPVAGHFGIYSNTEANEKVTNNPVGTKSGESCITSYFGFINLGDASVSSAAKAADIQKVSVVDNRYTTILGFYSKYCIVAYGE